MHEFPPPAPRHEFDFLLNIFYLFLRFLFRPTPIYTMHAYHIFAYQRVILNVCR